MSAAAQPRSRSLLPALPMDLARQGFDTLSAAFKIVSDLSVQEFAMLVRVVQERVSLRPPAAAAEIAGRAVTGLIGAEKVMLDLAADESALLMEGFKEGLRPPAAVAAIAEIVPRGVGTMVEIEKRFLDTAIEETNDLVESYAERRPLMPVKRAKKLAQQQLECFIETQKALLDQVSEQVTLATEASKEPIKRTRERAQVVTQLAREGVNKLLDAEKQLVELAFKQFQPPKMHEHKPEPRTSWKRLTRESVHNITTAQKSLLDLAIKPIKAAPEVVAAPKGKARKRARAKK